MKNDPYNAAPCHKNESWRKVHIFTIKILLLTVAIVWGFLGLAEMGILPYCGREYYPLLTVWACLSIGLLLIIELILMALNKGSWIWIYTAHAIAMLNFFASHFFACVITDWDHYNSGYFPPQVLFYFSVGALMSAFIFVRLKQLKKGSTV